MNPVLWTLEVEVQFYVIAPILLYLIFHCNNSKFTRRFILLTIIFSWKYLGFIINLLNFRSILTYFPYFLIGVFSADIYLDEKINIKKNIVFDFICILSLIFIFINPNKNVFFLSIMFLLTLTSKSNYFLKLLEQKLLYIIGGLCYSIYMLHQKLIYLLHAFYPTNKIYFDNYYLDFIVKFILPIIVVLIISSIFLIFIERPTMKKIGGSIAI